MESGNWNEADTPRYFLCYCQAAPKPFLNTHGLLYHHLHWQQRVGSLAPTHHAVKQQAMDKGGIRTNHCFRQIYSSKCLKGFPQQLQISLLPDVEADFTCLCKPAIHWCNKKRPRLFKCCADAEMMCILTSSSKSNKHHWFSSFWTGRCCRKPLSYNWAIDCCRWAVAEVRWPPVLCMRVGSPGSDAWWHQGQARCHFCPQDTAWAMLQTHSCVLHIPSLGSLGGYNKESPCQSSSLSIW